MDTKDANAEQCRYDEDAGELTCGYEASCAGGSEFFGGIVIKDLTVTFDCKKCDEQAGGVLLRPGCCETCKGLQDKAAVKMLPWKNQKPDRVICNGCDKADLKKLVKDNSKQCSFQDNKFQCKSRATCKIGQGVEKSFDNTYQCKVTPCGACQNAALKAECCSECLQRACSSRDSEGKKELLVCTGCDQSSGGWFR